MAAAAASFKGGKLPSPPPPAGEATSATKPCPSCKSEKPLSEFPEGKSALRFCFRCRAEKDREAREKAREKGRAKVACECGVQVAKSSLAFHKTSKQHALSLASKKAGAAPDPGAAMSPEQARIESLTIENEDLRAEVLALTERLTNVSDLLRGCFAAASGEPADGASDAGDDRR